MHSHVGYVLGGSDLIGIALHHLTSGTPPVSSVTQVLNKINVNCVTIHCLMGTKVVNQNPLLIFIFNSYSFILFEA